MPPLDAVQANLILDIAVILGGVVTGVLVARITTARTRSIERERREAAELNSTSLTEARRRALFPT